MEGVEYIEGEASYRPNMRRWEYPSAKELRTNVRSSGAAVAAASLNVRQVNSTAVYDRKVYKAFPRHFAWIASVSEMHFDAQTLERDVIETNKASAMGSRQ